MAVADARVSARRARRPLPLLATLAILSAAPLAAASDCAEMATDAATLQLQQYDSLRVARCSASCWTTPHDAKDACETACLHSRYSKPGACPDVSTLSAFEVACIDACSGDADCSSTDKCCTHACGVTCQGAQGLDTAPGLPLVPSNLTASERKHGRTAVVVDWFPGGTMATGTAEAAGTTATAGEGPVLFVIQERHHVGLHLSLQRLGTWTARHRSSRANVTLRGVVRPGRWYQFRVAAVNANGSRGFSEPSQPFRLTMGPRPPGEPHNLTVGALSAADNGSLGGLLRWMAPASDLPVERYKVFWSRRLDEAGNLGGATPHAHTQRSVLVHHQTVRGDAQQFLLKSLEPNSLYFIQIQAIAQYGRDRLKGDKAAIFLDTGKHPISRTSS